MYKRVLDLPGLLRHKSFFLLGPRQTGKSTLLRASFPEAVFVDLLESETFHELSSHPERLRQRQPDRKSCLVVDEIQKLPVLLNEVQLMLDRNPALRVVMTGSSARKLRRGTANLLGGRAWMAGLNPSWITAASPFRSPIGGSDPNSRWISWWGTPSPSR